MSTSPCSGAPRRLRPSRMTVHDRGAHYHFRFRSTAPMPRLERPVLLPATSNGAIADTKRTATSFARSLSALPRQQCTLSWLRTSLLGAITTATAGPTAASTPIGRTGQRGSVQSGFNDVPHRAAPLTSSRDLVEPSCILEHGVRIPPRRGERWSLETVANTDLRKFLDMSEPPIAGSRFDSSRHTPTEWATAEPRRPRRASGPDRGCWQTGSRPSRRHP